MRKIGLVLCLCILLTGCAPIAVIAPTGAATTSPAQSTGDEPSVTTKVPETVETTAAATTEPADPILELLEIMSLEELVGQLFLVAPPENPLEAISTYHFGGYILFDNAFKGQTPSSVTQTLATYQSAAAIPMLIAVDEEGGSVCRVSTYPAFRASRFPSPRKLFEQGGLELCVQTEEEKSKLLRDLGINVNMAPVCDITTDSSAFMYSRSLGQSAEITAQYIAAVVKAMNQYQTGSVLKHFPGYGNNTDTHVAMAVDNRKRTELENVDLVPFQAGIDAGCGAVLVSHTIVTDIDSEFPATLSPAVHNYLRTNMHFDGVIITDDLEMDAIADHYGAGEAAVLAVLAGNDILCSWSYEVQYDAVLDAVRTGRIPIELLNASVLRILRWKQQLGLFS